MTDMQLLTSMKTARNGNCYFVKSTLFRSVYQVPTAFLEAIVEHQGSARDCTIPQRRDILLLVFPPLYKPKPDHPVY